MKHLPITPRPYLRTTQGDTKMLRIPAHKLRTKAAANRQSTVRAYEAYKAQLRHLLPSPLPASLGPITFRMPMADSWSKTKKTAMLGQPHQQKPDIDNLLKALMDASGTDDSHVHEIIRVRKVWAEEGAIIFED